MNSTPGPAGGESLLTRLSRIGPRKKAVLAALPFVLAIVWFATRQWPIIALVAAGLLVLLLIPVTLAIELLRWRDLQRRRADQALRGLGVHQRRADKALRELGVDKRRADQALRELGVQKRRADKAQWDLGVVRSQLETARKAADHDRTWRDIRAGTSQMGTGRRTRLFVFPMGKANAYHKLIYQEFPRWNFEVLQLARVSDFDAAQTGDVVHYHWTKHVQSGCNTAAEARTASDTLLRQFRTLQQRGVTIVWGVHEILPHECPYPDVELEFRQSLANLADVVQVLHESTNAALDGAFTIPPEKTLVVPHPLYTGAQADHVSRAAVRADLGYGTNDLVLLGFGSIRPYKGHERVIRMLPSLQEQLGDRRLTFVIAGATQRDPVVQGYVATLEAEVARLPDPTAVRLIIGTVPESYLQMLMRCADVSVAPYRDGLNSGVLLLNMTYGVPTVIASNVVTDDISRFGPVSTFPADDDDALRRALIDRLTATSVPPIDPQFVEDHSPVVVSAAFAQALRARLRRPDIDDACSPVVAAPQNA